MAKIVTFYSYKGGTGRSMALANVAWVLASNGKRILVIDWDLEAPGLHRYFAPFLADKELVNYESQGVIEFFTDFASRAATPARRDDPDGDLWYERYAHIGQWSKRLVWPSGEELGLGNARNGSIDFVPAGRQGPDYASRVTSFDWNSFYERFNGGAFIDAVRENTSPYDYVLIDSRTGVSDTSGICTVQLPDALVVCFTLNHQSITGAAAVVESIRSRRRDLRILPVATRIDASESKLLNPMKAHARHVFGRFLSRSLDPDKYWFEMEVPYFGRYAYAEKLAPFEEQTGISSSMLPSMERLTAYITESEVTALGPLPEAGRVQALAEFETDPVERDLALRRDAFNRGREEFDALMNRRQFEDAIAKAEELIEAFPEEETIPEELQRAHKARAAAQRRAALEKGLESANALLAAERFADALACLDVLVPDFPDEPEVRRLFRRAEELRRREETDRAVIEVEGLLRRAEFESAVARLRDLIAEYPDENRFRDALRHAEETLNARRRTEAIAQGNAQVRDLMSRERFREAIALAERLLLDFPDDPSLRRELEAAKSAGELRRHAEEIEAEVAGIQGLFHAGDTHGVGMRCRAFLQKHDDPRVREMLKWSESAESKLKTLQQATAAAPRDRLHFRWLVVVGLVSTMLILYFGFSSRSTPPAGSGQSTLPSSKPTPPASPLRISPTELSFAYVRGGPAPAPQSIRIVAPAEARSLVLTASDPWLSVSHQVKPANLLAVSVDTAGLNPGEYSAFVTISTQGLPSNSAALRVRLTVTAKAVTTKAPSPPDRPAEPEPAIDCHAALYGGLSRGDLQWGGMLEPGQSVTIDRRNDSDLGLRARGDHIPGCAVDLRTTTPGLSISTAPNPGNKFGAFTITNTSKAPVEGVTIQWTVK